MRNISDVQRGGQLKTLRERASLSQKAVADHFGIDKSAVSEWERGLGKPKIDKLAPLGALYGDEKAVLNLFGLDGNARGDGEPTIAALFERLDQLEKTVLDAVSAAFETRDKQQREAGKTLVSIVKTMQSMREELSALSAHQPAP